MACDKPGRPYCPVCDEPDDADVMMSEEPCVVCGRPDCLCDFDAVVDANLARLERLIEQESGVRDELGAALAARVRAYPDVDELGRPKETADALYWAAVVVGQQAHFVEWLERKWGARHRAADPHCSCVDCLNWAEQGVSRG